MISQQDDSPEYVQRFDSVPQFWQYLRGLRVDDLITELVQNELDANSYHTRIVFDVDRMVCEGDGESIDEDGWERLSFVMGAGDQVPPKKRRIGIKNHGIKACFTIGDDINIRSDRRMINQTLYRNGVDHPPSPATLLRPVADETAPNTGCRIEVPYRRKALIVDTGEPFKSDPPSSETMDRLFLRACKDIPWRFIGALNPRIRQRYSIELSHHRLGTARFQFSCGRRKKLRALEFYNRVCRVSGDVFDLPHELSESCCLFDVPIPSGSNREIPDFYASRGRFFHAEVAWETKGRNRPVATQGRRRYPIAYGGTDQSALTRLGIHFSGPYISDLERHGAVDADTFNSAIESGCISTIIAVLRQKLIFQYGAKVLSLLFDPQNPDEEVLREMTERLLETGSFPTVGTKLLERQSKGPGAKRGKRTIHFGPRREKGGEIRRLVIPAFTWEKDRVSPLLAQLCPVDEDQIDPSVPGPFLKMLGQGDYKGWCEDHITFDENDVIERLQPKLKIRFFPWGNNVMWDKALGKPSSACLFLDVLLSIYKSGQGFDNEKLSSLLKNSFLPDTESNARPLPELYAGMNLPTGLAIKDMPSILHPMVAKHRIFTRKGWKRDRFEFGDFLDRVDLPEAEEGVKGLFWQWLKTNWKSVPKSQWTRIAELPIWPDESAIPTTLSALCRPSKRVAAILKDSLRLPHPEILKISVLRNAKRGKKHIRTRPNEDEIASFIDRGLSVFPRNRVLSSDERKRFHAFQSDLAVLTTDSELRKYVKNHSKNAVALNGEGCIRTLRELVKLGRETDVLHLLAEDVIDREPCKLDRTEGWSPLSFPSSTQILKALQRDAANTNALLRRLIAYLQAVRRENKEEMKEGISNIKCIPHGDTLYAPAELAFTTGKGDYWCSWKHRISGKGLSADVQRVYRDVGVLESEPTTATSHAFFEWLNRQNMLTIVDPLGCIMRHINHRKGPISWSEEHPDCPYIPTETKGNRISLVSKAMATAHRSHVYIPDFDPLAKAIREAPDNRGIRLAILSHPSVTTPITPYLRMLEVKSLRDYAGNPTNIVAEEPREAPKRFSRELDKLRRRRMARELRKRLDRLGLDTNTFKIRAQWHDRLSKMRDVSVATSLTATFQLGRYRYAVTVDTAFDEKTGTIWLTDSNRHHLPDLFYQTIAEQIFENPAEFISIILKEALRREFREEDTYGKGMDYAGEVSGDDDSDGEGGEEENGDEPGGTEQTHKGVPPDTTKNLPKPGVIPTGISGRLGLCLSLDKARGGKGKGDGQGRKRAKVEEIQIQDLKQNQYAWHCQMCLAERTTEKLAPVDSYVHIQENRSRIMRTHHPDQVHATGARHAGNMLVLCNFHHRYIGDAISRQDVTEALKQKSSDHQVTFQTSLDGKIERKSVSGTIVTIAVPTKGETIKCFFTKDHADYWLRKAT